MALPIDQPHEFLRALGQARPEDCLRVHKISVEIRNLGKDRRGLHHKVISVRVQFLRIHWKFVEREGELRALSFGSPQNCAGVQKNEGKSGRKQGRERGGEASRGGAKRESAYYLRVFCAERKENA
jgi:hypothetical protein